MNKRFIKKLIGLIMIAVGLGVLLSSIGLNVRQYFSKEKTIKEFKEYIASGEGFSEEDIEVPAEGEMLCILRIPSIESENPVRQGLEKSILSDSLGHDMSTVVPGQKGNCVIAGHRNYTFGKFFNRLDEVQINDLIYVDTPTQTYTYAVTEIKTAEPDDLSVLDPTDKEQLTLYTCTPIYVASHRLVIIAERVQ